MIKRIGETDIKLIHNASCHCGEVVLELELPNGVVDPKRCNCSLCKRRGAVMGTVPLTALRILKGAHVLRSYRFNTQQACHYFCSICGVYTHHTRRSDPSQYAYNVGCLDGVDPNDLGLLPLSNGRSHPLDKK
ncbi:MAG: aldehyde-activating protein [Pseudomonas sp.]|jgi:hypothetical protein|uniref:GFA family protein n=1 Tax=Pseudomonas sp. TaxID=306 RepID=UPI002610FBED|nr:GFA family protein [Pseudomonas sp.]MDB6052011.1 aldehyde-activating protein [Pseudomonas sp.]